MKFLHLLVILAIASFVAACGGGTPPADNSDKQADLPNEEASAEDFEYLAERFDEMQVLRYRVAGFDELPLQHKELLYYLYEAALSGRDIMYDQNYKYNLTIRRTLEAIYNNYSGDKSDADFEAMHNYLKRMWFASGIHHHYSRDKNAPSFSEDWFKAQVAAVPADQLPLAEGQDAAALADMLTPVLFDPSIDPKKTNKAKGIDKVAESAVNFYEGVTEAEVTKYYKDIAAADGRENQPEHGLNTKLVKQDGKVVAQTYKVGGMYNDALEKVAYWLEKAAGVAENDQQKAALEALVAYYRSGDVEDWDAYNIEWVKDTLSDIDVINGFIEVYNDPMGKKGSFESVVSVRDPEASKRIQAISAEAQWFEDNSPLIEEHKKKNVKGVSAKVINVVMESGDASPTTPIGINLPNNNWVRENHGSKSVNLGNIVEAYDEASAGSGFLDEFCYTAEEADRSRKYGGLADKLHTDMHEVIGHASGQREPGIGTPSETLKNYASTLEEGRADLVALYYLMDQKLIDLGLMESLEVGKAAYDDYIRNGMMTQLKRIKPGDVIEEEHMRNRQMVAAWAYEKGKADNVIERVTKDDKTYFVVNDYEKLRVLFGELLREIQRIKSQGDFEAGMALVEDYGVQVDPELHKEVLARFESLDSPAYSGFINPKLVPVMEGDKIVDVKIEYPADFTEQHLEYSKTHSFLPSMN